MKNSSKTRAEHRIDGVIAASSEELTELVESIVSDGGTAIMESRGNSMKPMLHFSKSLVKLSAPDSLMTGDVLLYRYPSGKCILHRLVEICEDGLLVCRGDNNVWTESIQRDWVVAKVVAFSRSGKWVSCDNKMYRLYWKSWLRIWPFRNAVHFTANLPRRAVNKLFRMLKNK